MKRLPAFLILMMMAVTALAEAPAAKKRIDSASDLPRRTYQLEGKAVEIIEDSKQLDRLAAELEKNLLADLSQFDIRDKATLSGYHSILLLLHIRDRDYDKALAIVPTLREFETKEAGRLMAGLFVEAYVAAVREAENTSSPEFLRAFEKHYEAAYDALPWETVKEKVEALKGQLSVASRELVLGGLQGHLQQLLDNTKGAVPEGVVAGLLNTEFMLKTRLPLNDVMLRVVSDVVEKNRSAVEMVDIWKGRDVEVAPDQVKRPVVVAVWDSGVDPAALPPAARWTNANEKLDGRDDDRNGYVDDVHGIGYDVVKSKRSVGTLDDPTGKIRGDVKRLQRLTKGWIDLQSSVSSEEAADLQKTLASLKRDEVKAFSEELGFYTGYAHGTHVAGIVAKGNPGARILGARMTHAYGQFPEPHTKEKARFLASMYRDTVAYFKANGVRVVNMSWRYNSASIESSLAVNGIGKDEKERKQLAREMFEIEKKALFEAIRSAPGILFVCASGNENNDANFSEYVPATFELPNLVTVGAVDAAGRKAAFTTEGKSVDVYANGFEVESVVPGGDRLKMSGTSMASPQVANLAAKLLVMNPALTPQELVRLIIIASEPSAEDSAIRLVNPAKSVELLRAAAK